MYEYIVTAFKVIVGVITNDRLAIAAAIALGIMLLWITFSLIFSFQARFASGVRKINNYVSRNGISGNAKAGLDKLISKMPSEFQRGYKTFERNPKSLPSENIKRFESLDMELSGGVFNQNKSVLKTYMNFVFAALLIFSFAILQDATLTGYLIAEAFITPAIFLLVSKVIYYIYTAIRQNQYRTAVEDFSEMLDNLDQAAIVLNGETGVVANVVEPAVENVESNVKPVEEPQYIPVAEPVKAEQYIPVVEPITDWKEELDSEPQNEEKLAASAIEEVAEEDIVKVTEEIMPEVTKEDIARATEEFYEEDPKEELGVIESQDVQDEIEEPINETQNYDSDLDEISAIQEYKAFVARAEQDAESGANEEETIEETIEEPIEESDVEINDDIAVESKEQEVVEEKTGIIDNFKPDFSSLLEEEEQVEVKRGRGRPRKEVREDGEFVIKNDKEFEEALVRAEKLMRKNEEPLSASQTKRIEKQIKELVDAMTKYKEGK